MKLSTPSTSEMIPVFSAEGDKPTVNARDLHEFLEVGKDFSTWIKNRIRQYGFIEDEDYLLTKTGEQLASGTKYRTDYYISLDMAKELAMVERNEKGRMARRYFIECEERLHESQNVTLEHVVDLLQKAQAQQGVPPQLRRILSQLVPEGEYGALAPNGMPRVGFRRSSWVTAGRLRDAAMLFTQLSFLHLLGNGDGNLAQALGLVHGKEAA